jgi:methyl-accepting chemotaxis protein
MKNWKTTLVGAIGAGALVIIQMVMTGTVDIKTIVIAAVMAVGLALAKDGNIEDSINSIKLAKELLPVINDGISKAADNSTSPLLKDVHTIVSTLTENVAALPSAVASAIPPVTSDQTVNTAGDQTAKPADQQSSELGSVLADIKESLGKISSSLAVISSPPAEAGKTIIPPVTTN